MFSPRKISKFYSVLEKILDNRTIRQALSHTGNIIISSNLKNNNKLQEQMYTKVCV